jgi:preprotein translocase subunit SecB
LLASIQLESYYINRIQFEYTPDSTNVEEKGVRFGHKIEYMSSSKVVEVTINCHISDESGLNLEIILVGVFKADIDEDETLDNPRIKELCERNTLSILFPYLRSAISDISLKANIDPIILPTINILALIDQKNNEEIKTEEIAE